MIRAFNADMPFDQFTIKQLAGDLLPNPTADDILATAFHRNTQNNTEGGTDDEEYRTAAVTDRVNTTWTTWQATTFACVQCHSHPYDPFPHKDYYRFLAFFNNTEDCDQNDDYPRYVFPREESKREEAARIQRESQQRRIQLNEEARQTAAAVNDWVNIIPTSAKSSGGNLHVSPEGRMTTSGTIPVSAKFTINFQAKAGTTAVRLNIHPDSTDPKATPERGQIFSKIAAALVSPGSSNQPVQIQEIIADYLAGPRDPLKALGGEGGGFGSYPVMKGPRECILVFSEPLQMPEGGELQITIEHGIASNSGFQGCQLRNFSLAASRDVRLTGFVSNPSRKDAWREWQAMRDRLKEFPGTSVPVMVERVASATRETRVFLRGNRTTLDEAVQPGIPDVVQPPKKEGPLNRLDMARWLVGRQNPLAARVLANRLWSEMFGHGIVETLGDFGTSGARPSHPELLDHLALRLRDDLQWSVKRFLREIALSSTYSQSSRVSPALLKRDPANHLLARGPRTRLTAEMVRDQALAVSGKFSPVQFGPPVYPPQPEGIWSTVYSGEKWNTSTNENRFRRGIYTYHRRTSGYPAFLTFDAPTRDACVAKRAPSNTPLQALVTLNDPAFVELAQALADRMAEGGGKPADMIQRGARILTLDKPSRAMVKSLTRLYEGALSDYRADTELASKLGGKPERAALVLVANTLLNLDPFIVR